MAQGHSLYLASLVFVIRKKAELLVSLRLVTMLFLETSL